MSGSDKKEEMMERKCNQHKCDNPARHRFTWPGKDESVICEEHLPKLLATANALGMYLQVRPLEEAEEQP